MNPHNPYTPPTAPVADTAPPAIVVRKPVSVWLVQIVCALAVLLFLYGLSTSIGSLTASQGGIARVSLLVSLLLRLLVASLFVTTIIAAQRRSPLGRWLGVFIIGSLLVLCVLASVKTPSVAQESFATRLGGFIGIALVLVALGLLLYFSAFSRRARAWYGGAPIDARS
jgi:hypothetical protein